MCGRGESLKLLYLPGFNIQNEESKISLFAGLGKEQDLLGDHQSVPEVPLPPN